MIGMTSSFERRVGPCFPLVDRFDAEADGVANGVLEPFEEELLSYVKWQGGERFGFGIWRVKGCIRELADYLIDDHSCLRMLLRSSKWLYVGRRNNFVGDHFCRHNLLRVVSGFGPGKYRVAQGLSDGD